MSTRSFPALGFDPAEGDQGAVQALLLQLATANQSIQDTLPRLVEACQITDDADWGGSAAEEFSDHGDDLPAALSSGGESMTAVSNALSEWAGNLIANQAEADNLESQAKKLKEQLQRAEAALRSEPDCTTPGYRAKFDAYTTARTALDRVIDKAKRLKAKHERQANAAAEAIRGGPDDAFKPENDGGLVQAFDGIAVAADGISLATGTIAAGLAATGIGLPAAAVAEAASTATGAVGSIATLGQQLTGSSKAPGWLAVGLGLGTSVLPGGGTVAAGVRGAGRIALKRGSKQALKTTRRELGDALTSGGVTKLAKDLNEIKDDGLRRKLKNDLKDAGKTEAKRLGVNADKLTVAELRQLGLEANQRKAYADLVDKGQDIAEKAGVELTPEQKAELKALQVAMNPTRGQVESGIEDTVKDRIQGR
jgi:hypothetical protein